eukprot:scaffold298461_cov35-Tisochrysis_lutea.AAC.1
MGHAAGDLDHADRGETGKPLRQRRPMARPQQVVAVAPCPHSPHVVEREAVAATTGHAEDARCTKGSERPRPAQRLHSPRGQPRSLHSLRQPVTNRGAPAGEHLKAGTDDQAVICARGYGLGVGACSMLKEGKREERALPAQPRRQWLAQHLRASGGCERYELLRHRAAHRCEPREGRHRRHCERMHCECAGQLEQHRAAAPVRSSSFRFPYLPPSPSPSPQRAPKGVNKY